MIKIKHFEYAPPEHEAEKASNSYLMSLIALIAGLPLPIINLLATFFFFVANRKGAYYVRWHCMQALLSQASLVLINGVAFWWTISIFFGEKTISNLFISYILAVFLYNLTEFIVTIFTAIKTRKAVHVEWWFYGGLTNLLCKEEI
jgi:uncharacterized membrane protein